MISAQRYPSGRAAAGFLTAEYRARRLRSRRPADVPVRCARNHSASVPTRAPLSTIMTIHIFKEARLAGAPPAAHHLPESRIGSIASSRRSGEWRCRVSLLTVFRPPALGMQRSLAGCWTRDSIHFAFKNAPPRWHRQACAHGSRSALSWVSDRTVAPSRTRH